MIDHQEREDQAEEEAPTMFLDSVCKHKIMLMKTTLQLFGPSEGGAEKLKLQDAIPPFSMIEDVIQGIRACTLVKTAYSSWPHDPPNPLLTIPMRV